MIGQLLTILLAASLASAWPTLFSRAVIAHDAVQAFPQTVPSGTTGTLYLKYKPYLKIFTGCVPFPAVQANGDTNGGLAATGTPSGGCTSSAGQVYARSGTYNGRFAIMYSWYMPKDGPNAFDGHRHEWENTVVWLSAASTSATILGVATSAHGDYETDTTPPLSGTRPKIGYRAIFPLNHQTIFTEDQGGEQPLIAWESLPAAARTALENANFEAATVPFKESQFSANLAKAAL